ncbi:hypothetical protein QYM36_019799 [Artemia franciscana]|uniref:Uncharacterized protein n=1 Tax=Artemia franciscana TaxID=6661 RepID=A0AA88H9Z3_ARTSF|nr:hypothetical protein QYM36_019799 [Artemia franciscana]
MSYEHDPPNYDKATSPPCYEEATEHTLIDTNKVEQSRNSDLKTLLRRYMIFLLIPITIGIIVYLYYAAVDLNRLVAEKERMNVTQDRSDLMDQLTRSEEDKQTLTKSLFEAEYEAERLRTIEDKLRSVLRTMAALHTMVRINFVAFIIFSSNSLSRRSVGRIIIEAVERSVDPQTKECNIIKFLATLQQSSSEMERLGTESLINLALSAVQ